LKLSKKYKNRQNTVVDGYLINERPALVVNSKSGFSTVSLGCFTHAQFNKIIGNQMKESSSPPVVQNPPKSSWVSGCVVTALITLFAILGIYNVVFGSLIAYIFSSTHMLSPANIAILLIIACACLIYFFLVFRIKRQHWFISLALLAVVWLVLPFPLRSLINAATARVRIDGFAMGTTLPNGSYVLADRRVYQQKEPQRGDIVVFSSPLDPNLDLIKRVIGLSGESIAVMDGTVTINGAPLEEPYITEPPMYNGMWVVPDGQFFVLGDNRNDSLDSHVWGFLLRENIIAKAVWIYYPLVDFGKIVDVKFPP
jgi:signal peptidase I